MILIGLGANLPSERFGSPRQTLEAALAALAEKGLGTAHRSSWYESSAVPPSDQPNFVNGVAALETERGPEGVLDALHAVEADFGRQRRVRWAARVVDLDLVAYHDRIIGYGADGRPTETGGPVIPHPRMHERRFVLMPLVELAPDWRHPVLDKTAAELLAALPDGEHVEKLPEEGGKA